MKAELRWYFASLGSNIAAGARLALFMRVTPLEFRISAGQYAGLVAVSVACWAAGGFAREALPLEFDSDALFVALAQIPALLFACLLAARIFGRDSLVLAFAVLFTAVDPVFELAITALRFALDAAPGPGRTDLANVLLIGWAFAVMLRAQWLLTGWRPARSLAACAVFAVLLYAFVYVLPRSELWAPVESEPEEQPSSIAREDLFHLQGSLLEFRLSELEPERPGVEDIYFVGVAPYSLQDTFARELGAVSQLMDERFDTAGRSILLVNNSATLHEQPIATATNLRAVIERIGAGINTDEDTVFLFLTSHGTENHEIAFELPPLELQQLTPTALARVLYDSGIKWKIVVISACYSGAYIEPLKDDFTLVITATDDTHSSFGCEYDSDFTWFGRAFFDQALRRTWSLTEAFENAKAAIAEREKRSRLPASNPQIYVGAAMKDKLDSLAKRLEAQGGGGPRLQAKL